MFETTTLSLLLIIFSFLLRWKTSQSNEPCTALTKCLQDAHPTTLKCFSVKTPARFNGSSMEVCRKKPSLEREVCCLFFLVILWESCCHVKRYQSLKHLRLRTPARRAPLNLEFPSSWVCDRCLSL